MYRTKITEICFVFDFIETWIHIIEKYLHTNINVDLKS